MIGWGELLIGLIVAVLVLKPEQWQTLINNFMQLRQELASFSNGITQTTAAKNNQDKTSNINDDTSSV